MIQNIMNMIVANIWIVAPTVWAGFMAYAVWYFTKAKDYFPITPAEARQLWLIHQSSTDCNGRKWKKVKHGEETVGFECECGYKHIQKRPITARLPPAVSGVSSVTKELGISSPSKLRQD